MHHRLLIALAACAVMLAGCKVSEEADGDKTIGVAPEVAKGAENAAEATQNVGAQMAMTAKIESTLRAAEAVKIEDLNVDTVGKTITLKGYVETEAEKAKAEQLTKDMAGSDYKIDNLLAVKSKL